jgi:hypothetical protein
VDPRYSFPAFDVATQRGGDVFSMEFDNEWEARAARHAADLAREAQRRSFSARRTLAEVLAAVSRGSAAAARHLEADAFDRSMAPGR